MFNKQNAGNILFSKKSKVQSLFSKNSNHSTAPVSVVGNFLNVKHNDLEKATRHKQDKHNTTHFN